MDELTRAGSAVLASPIGEPTPIDRLRPRALRRVQRRRVLVAAIVVVALAVPAVAFAAAARSDRGSVGIHTVNTNNTHPTAPATNAPPQAHHPLAIGARVEPDDLFSMSFIDNQHGFALTLTSGHATTSDGSSSVAVTTDGGATWRSVGAAPKNVSAVAFTSIDDGWAYSPDRLVTHDGGRTWRATHPDGDVDALEALGSSVWSLVGCTPEKAACVDHLERSDDGGRTWQSTTVSGLPAGPAQLDRVDATHAFVWSAFNSQAPAPALLATSDGGTTWQHRPNPCGPTLAGFSAVDRSDLWLSCSYSGTAAAPKQVFRSHDAGTTWTLASRVGITGLADVGRLDVGGYGADLLAVSDRVAILGSARGNVAVTTDGGVTWSTAIAFGEFFGTLTRLHDTSTIWVDSAYSDNNVGVWRSTDGVHFKLVARGARY